MFECGQFEIGVNIKKVLAKFWFNLILTLNSKFGQFEHFSSVFVVRIKRDPPVLLKNWFSFFVGA